MNLVLLTKQIDWNVTLNVLIFLFSIFFKYFNFIFSNWKCKENVTQVAVSPSGDLCVTGNINISLWDVRTQKCLRKFMGHSSELCNLTFINEQHFLSCGVNDRHISTWYDQFILNIMFVSI